MAKQKHQQTNQQATLAANSGQESPDGEPVAGELIDAAQPSLASRLFARNWRLGSQYTDEHLAERCLVAADIFEQMERERTENATETT